MVTIPQQVARRVPGVLQRAARVPGVRRTVSTLFINHYAYAVPPRPRAWSMGSDYTSWPALTDVTFSGRHLPPASPEDMARLPSEAEVVALFRREREVKATDTSVLFVFFAQWFTDSFLRTSHDDHRRHTANQHIDLCQIYGLSEKQTHLLRAFEGGRLKSQRIDGQEYPPFYFEPREPGEPLVVKPEFAGLHDEDFIRDRILGDVPDERRDAFFAVGLEHGNSTIGMTLMNTVFLREHNRIAGLLAALHPDWDDDRVFETTRNIMIVLLVKLVVEDYIKHIGPFDFPLEAVPFIADRERWNRTNAVAVEFNLLYRWHPLVPEEIPGGPQAPDAQPLSPRDFRNNNPLVLARGLESLLSQCSRARAGKIGLRNTPRFLVDRWAADQPSVEERTVALMRRARLRSFNDYRELFGLRRLRSFEELTSDADLRAELQRLYGDIDSLEWYVGIFAEEYADHWMMGQLLTTMVANDAFTQALTNPLLGRQVFNAATFTELGLEIIGETHTVGDIVARNTSEQVHVSMSC